MFSTSVSNAGTNVGTNGEAPVGDAGSVVLTHRQAAIAACRAAARHASAQASLTKATEQVAATLEEIERDSRASLDYEVAAVAAEKAGDDAEAGLARTMAQFLSTQVRRMRATPQMDAYFTAMAEVAHAREADAHAMRVLDGFTTAAAR